MTWIPPPAGASGWSAKSEGGRFRSHDFLNGIHMEISNIAMGLRIFKNGFHNELYEFTLVMTNIPIEHSHL